MSEEQEDKELQELAELDQQIGKRHLVISVDDKTGEAEVDTDQFAPWECLGLLKFALLAQEDEIESSFFVPDDDEGDT